MMGGRWSPQHEKQYLRVTALRRLRSTALNLFFMFLLICLKFHIIDPNPNHFSVLPHPSSTLKALSPQNNFFFCTPSFPPLDHILICWSCIGDAVFYAIYPFVQSSFPYKWSLQWVVGLVQGLWLLVHHQYWTLTETSLRLLRVIDFLGHDLQDQPVHIH